MTTIAYRDGIMAADSRGYAGRNLPLGIKTKIRRLDDGTLIGCSSSEPGQPEAVMDWYAQGCVARPVFKEAKFTLLVVKPDGSAFYAESEFYLSGPCRAPFYAIGSGEQYAHGAMEFGATAHQAVQIATRCDVWSDVPVTVLQHDGEAA